MITDARVDSAVAKSRVQDAQHAFLVHFVFLVPHQKDVILHPVDLRPETNKTQTHDKLLQQKVWAALNLSPGVNHWKWKCRQSFKWKGQKLWSSWKLDKSRAVCATATRARTQSFRDAELTRWLRTCRNVWQGIGSWLGCLWKQWPCHRLSTSLSSFGSAGRNSDASTESWADPASRRCLQLLLLVVSSSSELAHLYCRFCRNCTA